MKQVMYIVNGVSAFPLLTFVNHTWAVLPLLLLTVNECTGVSLSEQSRSVFIVRVTAKSQARVSADWLKPSSVRVKCCFYRLLFCSYLAPNVSCDLDLTPVGYRCLCTSGNDENRQVWPSLRRRPFVLLSLYTYFLCYVMNIINRSWINSEIIRCTCHLKHLLCCVCVCVCFIRATVSPCTVIAGSKNSWQPREYP